MVNISELPINAVNVNKPKTLIGLGQKASSWLTFLFLRLHGPKSYRRRGRT